MFECQKCKKWDADYDYKTKEMVCNSCGHREKIIPTKNRCHCGYTYLEYTWFDPSGCPKCRRSFVE